MDTSNESCLWEWDSVLLLANPILDSGGSPAQPQQSSQDKVEPHQPEQQQQQQRRRRDPRLTCPNFLAGRVPCACSDVEDEEEDDRLHKRSKLAPRCQVPNCHSDLAGLKGYHQRHRVCLTCANATSVFLRNQQHRYCQQCGKFHPLADFDSGKRSCRRKLEKHNNRRRRSLPPKETDATPNANNSDASDGAQRLPETPPATTASASAVYDLESQRQEEPQNTSRDDHQSFFASLLLEQQLQTPHEHEQHTVVTRQDEQPNEKHPCATRSSSDVPKHPTYTSPCPTRRISFKFYDWNPADFPRRLREQILEWLANMPVELEGYIRSGCTILTLYIAMAEDSWSKLAEDWNGHISRLVRGSESGFWDKGLVAAFLDGNVGYIDHGVVSSPDMCDEASKRHPVIHSAFPLCLEAGKRSSVTVTGQNLLELNSRLLVGSVGQYLPCLVISGSCSLQVELVAPQRHGVAFIEVAHDYGVSNFVPLLVADKVLRQEFETLKCGDFGEQQDAFNLLTDLGWLIRCFQDTSTTQTSSQFASSADTARLQRLLKVAVEQGWRTTAERLLHVARDRQALNKVIDRDVLDLAQDPNICRLLQTAGAEVIYSYSKAKATSRDDSCSAREWKLVSFGMTCSTKYRGMVKAAMGLAVACAGVCIVLQHPRQVMGLSASLRRCLWYKQQT